MQAATYFPLGWVLRHISCLTGKVAEYEINPARDQVKELLLSDEGLEGRVKVVVNPVWSFRSEILMAIHYERSRESARVKQRVRTRSIDASGSFEFSKTVRVNSVRGYAVVTRGLSIWCRP